MLHRSFKPAKCKTSLKLAVSRIKLMKNKKDAQVKQIKRELAQLLETGQDRTARIRVEHVLREEKTKAAYELIEIYCELIAARLPIIESQKNCPIDLKEAITSVIYASPRCADIPELMDVRKHFTAKYGKEFVNGAVELRPDCGVSRMLVEKLSAKSPDGPAKMKILAAIAEEHNVKWDPESFEEKESKPPEDLLNGPNTYGLASKIHVEPPRGPPPPNHDVKEPSIVQPPRSYENRDSSMNFNERNARSSPHFQDSASSNVPSNKATTSGTFHSEGRSSGNRTGGMENRHSVPGDGNASSFGGHNWNMNFKDAASAAQAAAESAEMASMAARAAAELSRQYSAESQDKLNESAPLKSSRSSTNIDPPVNSRQMAERYPQQKSSEPEKRDSVGEVSTKRQSSNTDVYASEVQTGMKPDNASYFGDMRSEEKSSWPSFQSNSVGEVSRKRQSSNTDVTQATDTQTGMRPDGISYFGNIRSEEKSSRTSRSNSSFGSDDQEDVLIGNEHISMSTGEQSIRSSSHSHSRKSSNDHENVFSNEHVNIFSNEHVNVSSGPGEDSFVSHTNIFQSTEEKDFYGKAAVTYDSGSDDDKVKFDVEDYRGQESSLYFPSPDRNSFSPKANLDARSSEGQADDIWFKSSSQLSSSLVQNSPPVFSENLTASMDSSQPNDLIPVAFDASDGPSSDSEEELDKSRIAQSTVSKFSSGQSRSASHRALGSSSSEEKVDYDELPTGQPSISLKKSGLGSHVKDDFQTQLPQTMKDSEVSEGCSCVNDTDDELRFGVLTGGLRNKGLRHPPYTRKSSGNSLSVKHVAEDTKIEQPSYSPTVRTSIVSGSSSQEPSNRQASTKLFKERSTRTPVSYVASTDDSSEDELSLYTRKSSGNSLSVKHVTEDTKIERPSYSPTVRTSIVSGSSSQEPYNLQGSTKLIKERSRRNPVSYASTDDSSEDKLSHRTNSQDPYNQKLESDAKTSSRSTFGFFDSEDSEVEEDLLAKTSTSNARPIAKLSRRTQPSSSKSVRSSGSKTTVVSSEQEWNRPVEQAAPKPVPESKRSSPIEASKSYRNISSTSSYATETLSKPSPQIKSSANEWNRPVEQAAPKPVPESIRSSPVENSKSDRKSSSRSSYATETLAKPLSQTKSSERPGSQEWHRPAEQPVSKPISQSKWSSPEETSKPFETPSSRISYATETKPKPLSQTKSSERSGSQERQRSVEQAAPKRIPESKRSSASVETFKPSAREQSSNLSPKSATAGSTESLKSSGSTVESQSKERASHVHPKLPDSDDIIAKFMALRQSRQ